MGIREKLGIFNAAVGDPVLALYVTASTVPLLQHPVDAPERIAMLGAGGLAIIAKNLYDYYRFGQEIMTDGWSDDIFHAPYAWQAHTWAQANRQENYFDHYKKLHKTEEAGRGS